jgi:hypothetical protein
MLYFIFAPRFLKVDFLSYKVQQFSYFLSRGLDPSENSAWRHWLYTHVDILNINSKEHLYYRAV